MVALPLMVTGYIVDLVVTGANHPPTVVYAISVVFVVVMSAVVVTFLILMRHGYRWARTLLTGGGIASVVYTGDQPVHGGPAPPRRRSSMRSPRSSGRC